MQRLLFRCPRKAFRPGRRCAEDAGAGTAPHKGRSAFGSVSGKTKGVSDAPYSYFLCRRPVYPEHFQGVIAKYGRAGSEKGVSALLQLSRKKGNRRACIPSARRMTARAQFAPAGSPPRVGRPSAAEDVAVPDADHKAAGSRAAAARKKREKAAAAKTPAPAQKLPGKKAENAFFRKDFPFLREKFDTLFYMSIFFEKSCASFIFALELKFFL